jgi:WD40 repeat protein
LAAARIFIGGYHSAGIGKRDSMSDVFISYSRHDQAFVQRLHDALKAADRDDWVDWEGIPPTAAWLQEVYAAIEAADTFVCVLSPDWLASPICQQELAHAVKYRKRLVPVVCRDVDPSHVDPAVASLNWIFLRPSDPFAEQFPKMLTALDADLEYVRMHTRLLVRAREWESKGHSASSTLRGADLNEAERWLVQASSKQPPPSAVQLEFIGASHRATSTRQRRLLAGVSIALVVTLILSILTYVQWQISQMESRLATARSLVAEGNVALLQHRQDTALLLDLQAMHTTDNADTRSALLRSLQYSPHIEAILATPRPGSISMPSGGTRGVAFTPDGGRVVAGDAETGRIYAWDVVTHALRSQFPEAPDLSAQMSAFALSPDGASVLFGGTLWDTASGTPIRRLAALSGVVPAVFASDSGTLIVGGNAVEVVDAETGQLRRQLTPPMSQGSGVAAVAISPSGQYIAASTCSQVAGGTPVALGQCLPGVIWLWNAQTGRLIHGALVGHRSAVEALAFSPDDQVLASGGSDGVRLWDVSSGHPIGTPLEGNTGPLTFSPDGNTLATQGSLGIMNLWNVPVLEQTINGVALEATLPGHSAALTSLAFSPNGQYLASADAQSTVILWNRQQGSLLDHRVCTADVASVSPCVPPAPGSTNVSPALSPDGKTLAVSGDVYGQLIVFLRMRTWEPSGQIALGEGEQLQALTYSPDGRQLGALVSSGGSVYIVLWDVAMGMRTGQMLLPADDTAGDFSSTHHLAFSPDGRLLAASSGPLTFSPDGKSLATSGRATLWNRAQASLVRALPANPAGVTIWSVSQPIVLTKLGTAQVGDVAFTPDGKLLATIAGPGTRDVGTVRLWDTQTGRQNGSALPDESRGKLFNGCHLAFSPDGKSLAAAYGFMWAWWDVASRQLITQPLEEPDVLQWDTEATPFDDYRWGALSAQFSPDGAVLLVADDFGISVWSVSQAAWEADACTIAHRNLTKDEWQTYAPSEPSTRLCTALPVSS